MRREIRGLLGLNQKPSRRKLQQNAPLQRKKVLQKLLAGFCEDGFGVELHALDFVLAVPEAHDNAVVGFCSDGKLAGQGFSFNDERVIAGGGEGVWKFAEDIFAVVMDLAGFAVKKFWGANDFSAESGAYGLVAETNS